MTIKVRMYPHLDDLPNKASGIAQVVKHYFANLPLFGVELVDRNATSYDLVASHAAAYVKADIHHSHGLLWTTEFKLGDSSWQVNRDLVDAIRYAKEITVPSEWVAEPFKRDLRIQPHVIPHGVDWDEWQHDLDNEGFVLWAKNRRSDGLDPSPLNALATAFPDIEFVTTFATVGAPSNIRAFQAAIPHHEMKMLIQAAAVVVMTDRETWGLLAVEAMAAGTPVLTVNSGAVPTFIEHGVSGYCYEPGNLRDARAGLAYCIEYGKRLGSNGRELARALTWRRACEQVADVYQLALQEQEPTIGVIIPCYNCGDTIEEAIASVANQSYEGLTDIVIVDDGSTDDVIRSTVQDWPARDRRVRYHRQENSGVAAARNAGAAQVRDTKYLCFLDADDRIEPGYIRSLIPILEAERTFGIAYTGVRVTFPDGRDTVPWDWPFATDSHEIKRGRKWPTRWDFNAQVHGENQIPTCCVIRNKAFKRMGGYRSRYCPDGAGSEDAELFLRLGAYGWGAAYIPPEKDALWVHAHGEGTVSGSTDYKEPSWRAWHPWTRDDQHPFASYARPSHISHPVRSYEQPLVSVIIPVGPGHEHELVNALDSLDAQTIRYWEAIVIWDFNWDDNKRVQELQRTYPHVKFKSMLDIAYPGWKGDGSGYARNFGASFAKAPFIAFLDADDYYLPEFLEECLTAIEKNHAIVYTDFGSRLTAEDHEKHSESKIIKYFRKTDEVLVEERSANFDQEKAMQRPVGPRPYVWTSMTTLLPKAWHDAVNGFDTSMETWEDCDYFLRLAWHGFPFHHIDKSLWMYNFSSGLRREKSWGQEEKLVSYLQEKWDQHFGDSKEWDVAEMIQLRS